MGARAFTDEDHQLTRKMGDRCRERREQAGYASPRALGRAIDPEEGSRWGDRVQGLESGSFQPRLSYLVRIAAALGWSVSDLVGDRSEDEAWHQGHRQGLLDAAGAISELLRKDAE